MKHLVLLFVCYACQHSLSVWEHESLSLITACPKLLLLLLLWFIIGLSGSFVIWSVIDVLYYFVFQGSNVVEDQDLLEIGILNSAHRQRLLQAIRLLPRVSTPVRHLTNAIMPLTAQRIAKTFKHNTHHASPWVGEVMEVSVTQDINSSACWKWHDHSI